MSDLLLHLDGLIAWLYPIMFGAAGFAGGTCIVLAVIEALRELFSYKEERRWFD
jgi:hypothetical protein